MTKQIIMDVEEYKELMRKVDLYDKKNEEIIIDYIDYSYIKKPFHCQYRGHNEALSGLTKELVKHKNKIKEMLREYNCLKQTIDKATLFQRIFKKW